MPQFPTTSISLLQRLRDVHDDDAWHDFVAVYRPMIYRLGRRRGLQESDADDLVQDVFTAIAQQIDEWEFDPERAKFRTWLSQVARNTAVTALRRAPKIPARGGTTVNAELHRQPAFDDEQAEVDDEYRRQVLRNAARRVRTEFQETTWQAFWLTAVEGVPVDEAAASLNRSAGAIYTSRSRVMKRLQEVVATFVEDD